MRTNTLYFVLADIFVPFFLNVSKNLESNFGNFAHLVSFLPRDHALLKKNSSNVYPHSLDEIDLQIVDESFYSEAEIVEMCSFMQVKLGGDFSYWRVRLLKITAYLLNLIETKNIDLIVIWNGQDFIGRSIAEIAKRKNIKCIFLENGYFPNTLQADDKGVNLAASVAKLTFDEICSLEANKSDLMANSANINIEISELMPLSKSQLVANFFKRILSSNYYHRYPELQGSSWLKLKVLQYKRNKIPFDVLELPKEFAFIPLQVHDDTQILLNSPLFTNPKDFLRHCYESIRKTLGENYPIIVKDHPEDLYRYDYDDIRQQYPDIIWLRKFNIDEVVKKSSFIMVINSSVGLQAIKANKKVIVFGDSLYSRNEICFHVRNKDETPDMLLEVTSTDLKSKIKDTETYISFIENCYFFKGSWRVMSIENIRSSIIKINSLSSD